MAVFAILKLSGEMLPDVSKRMKTFSRPSATLTVLPKYCPSDCAIKKQTNKQKKKQRLMFLTCVQEYYVLKCLFSPFFLKSGCDTSITAVRDPPKA